MYCILSYLSQAFSKKRCFFYKICHSQAFCVSVKNAFCKYFVIYLTISIIFISWSPNCLSPSLPAPIVSVLIWPEITSTGIESVQAPYTPVMAFVPPGPLVTTETPMLPVVLEYASAAIEHACSWWLQIYFHYNRCLLQICNCCSNQK